MFRATAAALAVAAAFAVPVCQSAHAATEDELKDLREQVRQLRETYEQRIGALEARLKAAEQSGRQAEVPVQVASQPALQAGSRPAAESAFNPGISLILNGTYGNLSRDPSGFRISGFVPTQGEVGPPGRGLSLGESEIVFSANIDPNFRGTLIAALSPDDAIEVEEGFIQTLGLANGLTVKAGRFLSALSYQNEIHAHAWDFTDAPLVSKAFLGNKLTEDGVQVKWIAPTDTYIDLGFELGRGRKFPGGPDGGRSKNGFGSGTVFAHVGGDIGDSTAWKLGLAHLRTSPRDRSYEDMDSTASAVSNSFTGTSRLWTLGGVLKWAPRGNATVTNLKLQGEYFRRTENGDLTYDTAAASLGTMSGAYRSRQSGWYLQSIYQFMPQWRAGYRYDRLAAGSTGLGLVDTGALSAADFPILGAYSPTRNTFMVDWSGSEFSRVRLQFARDRSRRDETDNQVFLQYIMSLGAHGAHAF